MLPYPSVPLMGTIYPDPTCCFRPLASRIITEETNYEMIRQITTRGDLTIKVESYKEEKLDANFKYGTASRTFGSIEFYPGGNFYQSSFMTKPKQRWPSITGLAYTGTEYESVLGSEAIAFVTAAGFIPSPWLIDQAAWGLMPGHEEYKIYLQWDSYIIKPSPDVVLRVLFP